VNTTGAFVVTKCLDGFVGENRFGSNHS
jgi:hypothetical protein